MPDDDLFNEEEEQVAVEDTQKQEDQAAAFERIKNKLQKAEKQLEKYKEDQEKAAVEKRNEALRNLAINFGNENIAELYPADAEVNEENFSEWASKYGWEPKEQEVTEQNPEPAPEPMPAGVKNFHQGGGAPSGAKTYTATEAMHAYHAGELTGEEFTALLRDGKIKKELTPEMLARHPEAGIRGFNEPE